MTTLRPTRAEEVVEAVRAHARVVPHGQRTKAPLVAEDGGAVRLDMRGLSGVSQYDAGEFTFTALAGTPLAELEALLAAHGQYMPFDPPLADEGATLGGTVAAGLNGSGRLRYGGVRDFVIGAAFVDGTGKLVHGGGRVVKNAAGFDLPKLMVGSMGRLGVLTELSFKVFPAPAAWCTLRVACVDLADALARIGALGRMPLDVEALDLEPPARLVIRVSGREDALPVHARRVGEATGRPYDVLTGAEDAGYWRAQRACAWLEPGAWLIKVPLTPRRVPQLEAAVTRLEVPRRYGVAANVAWLSWPAERPLSELVLGGLAGLVVRGPELRGAAPWLGAPAAAAAPFAHAVKSALDPRQRLPALV